MAGRVQFREDPDLVRYVEERGMNANELARRLFEAEVRRLRAEDRAERLRQAGVRLEGSTAPLVREDRER